MIKHDDRASERRGLQNHRWGALPWSCSNFNMKKSKQDILALVFLLLIVLTTYYSYNTLNELMYYLDEIENIARYGDPTFKVVKYLK